MNTKQKRKRRERLFKMNPHCYHCGCKLVLPMGEPHKTEPENSATLEHIRTRLNPLRQELNDGVSTRTVLSCWKCCNKGAADEQGELPKEELWKRSGRQPQTINNKSLSA